ncbi:hypothetical protein [Parasphingorhabdus sp.]|uniref:hypothetical protein n=1 Tax=Parasphingorhabdus sp. TaxID=2709688 RepID=UPI003C792ADE
MKHPLTWASPRPMWRGAGRPGLEPGILRFARDDFADQLIGLMINEPQRIDEFVARPETWRTPPGQVAQPDLVARVPLPALVKEARRKTLFGVPRKSKQVSDANIPVPPAPLKLFQAAHQRHYVATATLACAVPGLPDRRPEGNQEKIGMLVRRLMPGTKNTAATNIGASDPQLVEYGWIPGDEPRWQRVAVGEADTLAPGEEMLPVFPILHSEANGIKRKMWGSMIPVARRDDYVGAPIVRTAVSLIEGQKAAMADPVAAAKPNSTQARLSEFRMDVAEPWKAMVRNVVKQVADINGPLEPTPDDFGPVNIGKRAQVRNLNFQLQMQSWLLLLDFSAFLERHLPKVKGAVDAGSSVGLNPAELALYNFLHLDISGGAKTRLIAGLGAAAPVYHSNLATALNAVGVASIATFIESVETEYVPDTGTSGWPQFNCLLVGMGYNHATDTVSTEGPYKLASTTILPELQEAQIDSPLTGTLATAAAEAEKIDLISTLIGRALPTSTEDEARALPFAERLSKVLVETAEDSGLFCVRFVHLNEDCGPLHPPTLSKPSERFAMASFFDPDAPAREIKIMLPKDTSAAGLRKHARGTAFVMSDMLCGQVQRAKGLGLIDLIRQVLPWPLHKDIDVGAGGGCKKNGDVDIGMICSLSIPIVTLCALILLMIIVSLLDFIFKWVPWLIACFPVPGLKAKGNGP